MNHHSFLLFICLLPAALAGCQGNKGPLRQAQQPPAEKRSRADVVGVTTSIADAYAITVLQGLDELRNTSDDEKIQKWAAENKLATALAVYTSASGPNDMANLFDLLTYATLKRAALEDHWIPSLLHDRGSNLLQTFRSAENSAWEASARVLMPNEIEDLRKVIGQWQKDNPGQYYVSHIRFAVLAKAHTSRAGQDSKGPSSIFGLLYLDPLAGLDPLAREVREVRQLSERMMFLMARSPIIVGLEADVLFGRVLGTPELRKVSTASEQIGAAAKALPEHVSAERKAAIDQLSTEFARQREGIVHDLNLAGDRLDKSIDKTDQLLVQARKTGESVNESTRQTVTLTEDSISRIVHRIFLWLAGLVVLLLVGIPLAMLGYRRRRALQARRDVHLSTAPRLR